MLVEIGLRRQPRGPERGARGHERRARRRTCELVYPADHPSEQLAGQTVDYTVTLKAIKTKVVPALDDEFAKDLGEFD